MRFASLLVLLPIACTSLEVATPYVAPDAEPEDARPPKPDAQVRDTGPLPDVGEPDAGPTPDSGPVDSGPLTEGPCRLSAGDLVRAVELPGRRFSIAAHAELTTTDLQGLDAIALDAARVTGFALRTQLPPGVDPSNPLAANSYIDLVLDPLIRGSIPGVVGVATRVDEKLKQAFEHRGFFAARTVRTISMGNDVALSRVRAGILANLSGAPVGALSGLPSPDPEAPIRELTLAAFVEADSATPGANVVLALSPTSSVANDANERAEAIVADLSNGTHVGSANPRLGIACQTSTVSPIQADFLWVVDNSASMQEEQEALADAATAFFDALTRTNLDFRLGVVSTDGEALRGGGFTSELGEFKTRVRVGINGNGREEGLEFAVRALERARTSSAPEERLRPEAVTIVIFYSDEDSTNLSPVDSYIARLADERALAFAIVGPRPRGCLSVGRGRARVGESYILAAEALGGSSASVCSEDLSGPIEEILIAAAGAASGNRLLEEPISGSIEVAFPARLLLRSRARGFDYEPSSASILLFGAAIPPEGTSFRITYQKFLPFEP
ncbi:MAG: hypothetical protein HYV07_30340 [Deltaproteobacteria bacterium]|nr:hypothetical protein [Deltaproteobacteria bacterium]